MLSLSKIETAGAVVNNIVLSPLQLMDVFALIGDTLNDTECSKPLAELLFHKTGGNPFFLTQLLKTLYQEDLLTYNFQSGMWQWDIQNMQAIGIADLNVVELMVRNIRKLSLQTQEVLKLAACIGNTFNLEVLAIVNEASSLTTAAQLWSAHKAIALAKENEYLNEEALAAKFYLSWGKETIARTYMTNAYYRLMWGQLLFRSYF